MVRNPYPSPPPLWTAQASSRSRLRPSKRMLVLWSDLGSMRVLVRGPSSVMAGKAWWMAMNEKAQRPETQYTHWPTSSLFHDPVQHPYQPQDLATRARTKTNDRPLGENNIR